jgi:hypothetical protein
MDCPEAQEIILESLVDPRAAEDTPALAHHLSGCDVCRAFAETQRILDARLTTALPAPQLSPQFRTALKRRIHQESSPAWPDFLPELAHFTGCALAMIVLLFLLPGHSDKVLLGGLAFTATTYLIQTFLRGSLEALDEEG